MSGYVLKCATSEMNWSMSWANGYLEPGECVAADLGWTVLPVDEANDLKVIGQSVGRTTSKAVFAGGVPGKVYMVQAQVQTDTGRVLERSVVMRIAA